MTVDGDAADASGLRLDQFLKLSGVCGTGGQAKLMIQNGDVKVNGVVETRRRRKVTPGDVVELDGRRLVVGATHGPR